MAVAGAAGIASALYHRRQAIDAERRLPPVGRFLDVDGVRLHYVERGRGPAIVLLHGVEGMIEEMEASGVIDHAARTNRVIVFDRPGYGYSERPRLRSWSPAAQAALLVRALRLLEADRPVIVGHSWGTLVALAMALDHPSDVGGLILIGGYYYPTARPDVLPFLGCAIPGVGDVLRHTVTPALARLTSHRAMARIFAPQPVPVRFVTEYPLALAIRPSQLRATDAEAAMLVPAAAALCRRYREIRQPLLILAGLGDHMVDPHAHSARLHEEIPHSALRLYPGVGHMLHHAMPDAVARAAAAMAGTGRDQRVARQQRDWQSDYLAGFDGGGTSQENLIDQTLADSFPASDPPAYMASVQPGAPAR